MTGHLWTGAANSRTRAPMWRRRAAALLVALVAVHAGVAVGEGPVAAQTTGPAAASAAPAVSPATSQTRAAVRAQASGARDWVGAVGSDWLPPLLSGQRVAFGEEQDLPVAGTYSSPGQTHRAVYRPESGRWYVDGIAPGGVPFGNGFDYNDRLDLPVPADYTGDGADELAVLRMDSMTWFTQVQPGGVRFGIPDVDVAVPANYSSSAAEIAVWRTTTGEWFDASHPQGVRFGAPCRPYTTVPARVVVPAVETPWTWVTAGQFCDDIPVPGDYDGSGNATIGIYRRSNGRWYTPQHPDGIPFGNPCRDVSGYGCDTPVPGNYGLGRTERAVVRDGKFYTESAPGGDGRVVQGGSAALCASCTVSIEFVFGPPAPTPGRWSGSGALQPGFFAEGFWDVP